MRCQACGHDNRPDRKFCANCGARLAIVCAACGAANEQGERFCGECGQPLLAPVAGGPNPPAPFPFDGPFDPAQDRLRAGSSPTAAPPNPREGGVDVPPSPPRGGTGSPQADQGEVRPLPSAVPASFVNGRYVVKRFLGEGGKKKVYLAYDTLLDRDVAFALIKMEGLDDAGRTRIRREAQATCQLT